MNQQEAFQLLGLIHSLTTYDSRDSEEALRLKASSWATVLEDVPYGFASQFILKSARAGETVRDVVKIAAAYQDHRGHVIREATKVLVPPDELTVEQQGAWLRIARKAVGDGAPAADAAAYADREFHVARQLTSTQQKVVPAAESIARIRKLAAQWGQGRAERGSTHGNN